MLGNMTWFIPLIRFCFEFRMLIERDKDGLESGNTNYLNESLTPAVIS